MCARADATSNMKPIVVAGRLRGETGKFAASLGYIVRLCDTANQRNKLQRWRMKLAEL